MTSGEGLVADTAPLSRRRLAVAHLLIIVMFAGYAYCLATDTEYWPFSQYPMYSTVVRPGPSQYLALVAVPAGGQKPEFSIPDDKYIIPFDWVRLARAFERLVEMPDHQRKLEAALRDCWARYDRLRLAGRHRGPPLQAVRLYRMSWDYVDPDTQRTDSEPDHRDLLAEVTARDARPEQ